jgi:hypothetical protein
MKNATEEKNCCVCQKPKATLECEICKSNVCKNCAQFIDENYFSLATNSHNQLKVGTFCGPCYSENIAQQIDDYNETIEKAKNITIFDITDSKLTRNFKRKEKPFSVQDCADRDEATLKLAFMAAKAGFNALIDVDIKSKKVRTGTYQTTIFSGSGIPVQLTTTRF